jgi:hypothetical protein|tara:strand:- start:548 stop:781 length:234 start_codon:yes stop_codon:yes gene_type:complete
MLITLRIWWWSFIEVSFWFTGGHKISALKQQRWTIRLAKIQEKESLVKQKESLTNWKDMVILYRLITKRLLTNMMMW